MVSTQKAKARAGATSCALPDRRERPGGRSVPTFAEGPAIPRWLSVLHRLMTLVVFVAVCLATVALVATLIHAGRLCYQRTVHTAHSLGASATSIRSTLGERP
jgi:hypothetical protein